MSPAGSDNNVKMAAAAAADGGCWVLVSLLAPRAFRPSPPAAVRARRHQQEGQSPEGHLAAETLVGKAASGGIAEMDA